MSGAGAPSHNLELLYKVEKRICKTVGLSVAASTEPLVHCRNVASLSLFYRYLVDLHLQLALLPYSRGRSIRYSGGLHDFSVTIPRCYNSFFSRTTILWNYLALECFYSVSLGTVPSNQTITQQFFQSPRH